MPNPVRRRDRKVASKGRQQLLPHLHRLKSHFGELIDTAALDPSAWDQLTDELRRQFPGVRVVIQAHDPSFGRPLVALASGWSDGYTERYNSYLSSMNEVAKSWSRSAPLLRPVLLPEYVVPIDAFLNSDFYNLGLKPEGEADCATGVRLFSEGKRQATFAIQYGLRQKDRMHERLSPLLQLIAPQMRGALLANRHTIRREAFPISIGGLNTLIDPAFVVDQNCRVVAANQPAQDLIASSEFLRIGASDILSFGEKLRNDQFARFIQASCLREPRSLGYMEFSFSHRELRFHASIFPVSRSVHLSNARIASLFTQRSVVLLILRCDSHSTNAKKFQARFALTNAELRIVQALSQEGSVSQISERLGLAYETARNQLKAALRKTNTHSQRELVKVFMETQYTWHL